MIKEKTNVAKLSKMEARVYGIITRHLEEKGESIGNREIADILDVTRNEIGRIRKSIVSKLDTLETGF